MQCSGIPTVPRKRGTYRHSPKENTMKQAADTTGKRTRRTFQERQERDVKMRDALDIHDKLAKTRKTVEQIEAHPNAGQLLATVRAVFTDDWRGLEWVSTACMQGRWPDPEKAIQLATADERERGLMRMNQDDVASLAEFVGDLNPDELSCERDFILSLCDSADSKLRGSNPKSLGMKLDPEAKMGDLFLQRQSSGDIPRRIDRLRRWKDPKYREEHPRESKPTNNGSGPVDAPVERDEEDELDSI